MTTRMPVVFTQPGFLAQKMVNGGASGVDPEGLELQKGRTALRLPFPQRVTAPGPLRAMLKGLAEKARENG